MIGMATQCKIQPFYGDETPTNSSWVSFLAYLNLFGTKGFVVVVVVVGLHVKLYSKQEYEISNLDHLDLSSISLTRRALLSSTKRRQIFSIFVM